MRVRLAEVYVRLGKKTEAWQIFSEPLKPCGQRGRWVAPEEVLQRMLTLDPANSYALLMQGRNLLESGDAEGLSLVCKKSRLLTPNQRAA